MRPLFLLLFAFLYNLITLSDVLASKSPWDLRFSCECSNCDRPPFYFEVKGIGEIAADVNANIGRNYRSIELKHNYKSPTKGHHTGTVFWKSGNWSRIWFNYEILSGFLKGRGQIESKTDCIITGKQQSVKISKFSEFCVTEYTICKNSVKFRYDFIKIGTNKQRIWFKNRKNSRICNKKSQKVWQQFTNFLNSERCKRMQIL